MTTEQRIALVTGATRGTGAATAVRLALGDRSLPNGGYFHLGQALPW